MGAPSEGAASLALGVVSEAISAYDFRNETEVSDVSRLPEIHPISDLSRDARALVGRARERQEPIVITQRGRQAAVRVPIELYRKMERLIAPRIASPRLARPEDAARFRLEMTLIGSGPDEHA